MRAKSAPARLRRRTAAILVTAGVIAFFIPVVRFFRTLTGAMAISNATDLINRTVSDVVEEKMQELAVAENSFIAFEKDEEGNITAIVTDTARVNVLSAELLSAVVAASDAGDMNLRVPLGDLLGISLFLGKGPRIPVRISITSSLIVSPCSS